jgi:hypothetical protein
MPTMEDDGTKTKLLVPPLNFALVAEGVYRSGHPLEINYRFLENLNLKTIMLVSTCHSTKFMLT